MTGLTWCAHCQKYVSGTIAAHLDMHATPSATTLVELHQDGWSYRAIAARCGRSRSWVGSQIEAARSVSA